MSIDLEAIDAREKAATPGPWIAKWLDDCFVEPRICKIPANGCYDYNKFEANSQFIAHAREDIPALLAEVERLNAENEAMQSIARHAEELDEQLAAVTAERDAAVEIGDALCEEVENCYGRETELTQRWHERSGENG